MGEDAAAFSREIGRDKMDPVLLGWGISGTFYPDLKALGPSIKISLRGAHLRDENLNFLKICLLLIGS